MSLEKQVTRDCIFDTNKDGKHYFTVREGNKVIFQSELYESLETCTRDGIGILDIFHEHSPLLSNNMSAYNIEYGVKYSG